MVQHRVFLTVVSDLDVVAGSDPAAVSVPASVHILKVDLAQEGHALTLHHVSILQLFHDLDVSGWQMIQCAQTGQTVSSSSILQVINPTGIEKSSFIFLPVLY